MNNKSATVGVIGHGYVGIPLVVAIDQAGYNCIGFDIDQERVTQLNSAKSPIKHFSDAVLSNLLKKGFKATSDFAQTAGCDFLLIWVPTPLNEYREPDLGAVTATMALIQPHLRPGQMLALESTTWPGTTQEDLEPFLQAPQRTIGEKFFLVYSPEREDQGNVNFETRAIPKAVSGNTDNCRDVGKAYYGEFVDKVVPVSSTRTAEMVKLVENIHRSVNIGLVNEIKKVAHAMDLDIFEVIEAAATRPFGFTPCYPGPGIGGHCIPIDPFYLTWKAREFGLHTRFIELAGEINAEMPHFVVDKLISALNQEGKSLKGAKVLCLGIAYKRDLDDMRESPAVIVMELLRKWGAQVNYSDEYVPAFPKMRLHQLDLESTSPTPENLAHYDAVILLTDYTGFDYRTIRKYSKNLIDSREKFRTGSQLNAENSENIIPA